MSEGDTAGTSNPSLWFYKRFVPLAALLFIPIYLAYDDTGVILSIIMAGFNAGLLAAVLLVIYTRVTKGVLEGYYGS